MNGIEKNDYVSYHDTSVYGRNHNDSTDSLGTNVESDDNYKMEF